MFKVPDMTAADFTCMLCGSRLELKLENLKVGDTLGECPMCSEPFKINLTEKELEEFAHAERKKQ